MARPEVTILTVDDDSVDTMAIRRSFKTLKIDNPIVEARNGLEALDHLRGDNGCKEVPEPRIVLLDLNMPRMNGIEFLEALRGDPRLQRTLVFVLTTSSAEEDRSRAYDMHIAGYLLKHRPGQPFIQSIAMLEQYWTVVDFPN